MYYTIKFKGEIIMKKILTCSTCGKRFIGEVSTQHVCPTCISISEEDDIPSVVAPINIMKLVAEFENVTKKREIVNMLREIAFITSAAYLRSYITREFYTDVCEEVGLVPDYEDSVKLNEDDNYDYSASARAGFYYDMFSTSEE